MKCLCATLCLLSVLSIDAGSARDVVDRFLRTEAGGSSTAREGVVEFSPSRKAAERQRDPLLKGRVVDWCTDPIVVVRGYRLVEQECTGERCTFAVAYRTVLRTTGYGGYGPSARRFARSTETETVRYTVVGRKVGLRIVDPPLPHVLLDSLIDYYQHLDDLKRDPADLKLESQKAYHQKLVTELAFLRTLQSESPEQ
jgi:hypothetical protein